MEKNLKNKIDGFVEKIASDVRGSKLIENIRNGVVDHNSNIDSSIEEIVKIAKNSGYDFSKEDFYNYIGEQLREIPEEELSKASGGKGSNFGGGNAGKYAALVAGAAGVGGVSYAALSGNVFGGENQKNTSKVENKDSKKNKIDKKSLDGLDKELKSDDGKIYGNRSNTRNSRDLSSSPSSSSKLKGSLKRRTPSYGGSYSYGSPYGSSSYGSPYKSSRGQHRNSRENAETAEKTAVNFLNKCTAELKKRGIDITPEQLSGAIFNGELEKALGNKYMNFAVALQSGDVDEAVNLVVNALTSDRDNDNIANHNEKIATKPKRGSQTEKNSVNKRKVAELLDKFEKEYTENQKKEKIKQEVEEKKEKEDKEDKVEKKNEEIKQEVKEKEKEEKKEKAEEKKEIKKEETEENSTEKIRSCSVNFTDENMKDAPVKSFNIVYIENDATEEEIKDWYTKVKENAKQETAVMFVGKNANKTEEILKKLDKKVSILKNKKLGENQFVAIIKDSEKKEVKNFFEKLKEVPNVEVNKLDDVKNGKLEEVVGQINKVFEEKENQKQKDNKEKGEKIKQENLKFIDDKIKDGGGIAKFQFLDKDSNARTFLLVNENTAESKIKELLEDENDIIIEVLGEKNESKVKKNANGSDWKETGNSFFSFDKAKSAKVFVNSKKDIAKYADTKNNILQNFKVIKLEEKNNGMIDFGTIKDFVEHVVNINSENKKKEEIKNKFQEKAKGTVSSDMNPNLMVEIKRILERGDSVNVGVTFNNFRDQVQRKATFIAKDHKIPNDITDCDFVIKKCDNPAKELPTINKEQNWFSRWWSGDYSLQEASRFVALPTEGMDKEKTTIFVRQGTIDAYINNGRGKEAIKKFLLEGGGKKYGANEENFEKYYTEHYTPKNKKYWENITEVYNSLPEFKNIIDEYRDDISIKIPSYDYIDSAKNFLETVEIINSIKPR